MISVGVLTKEKAEAKYGITMHARKNGDAGNKVWLQFKKEGWLEKSTYAELRMEVSNESADKVAWLEPGGFPPEILVDGVRYRSTWVDTEHPPFEKEPRTIRPGDVNGGGEFTLDRNWVQAEHTFLLRRRKATK
jgi:hypothetical protein